ncbi:ribosome-associated translation inhibitor RaiA [Romboutsia weinsteinii]|uniref:Ribosome hibernation promoting factor n=1 Tax=Romboutsia weinsteinii TaxID=2020949 RepID=A0A371JAB7_9FIRM|nr:ribosome-associated translation inhibitor RaiA [Romboutsia weinsteinii]RDY29720.1 ribosome-associated translation inhibitor RaiA [Romboutsia weinsteinii]
METNIYARQIKLTEGIEEYICSSINRLEKYLNPDSQVKVRISTKDNRQKIEVTAILTNGPILRAEECHEDLYSAIDMVCDRLNDQVVKYTDKIKEINIKRAKSDIENLEVENENKKDIIFYKKKKFLVKPMSVEEAILQMELLGHDFYMFRNQDTYDINVTYKRDSGGYGLIEEE